ncbi:zinc finger protein 23-like isoform X1 [Pieris napi]|uniref:zinc finger protein 23-like isoform X1 n=1 Tax=Pieris napi TaxID=78633 RepID=UPI001FBAD823|nr:zinc finger protein 23-like isoform X1 [Pieris napi]
MSSYLCFLCHSTVNDETNEETREKYKEVVGIHLCPDSHLCYICCHVLHKLFMFRSICLKRSLEYPVLFSEKGTINLHRSDIEINILCPEECDQYQEKQYHYDYNNDFNTHFNDNRFNDNQYVELEDEYDYFNKNQYDVEKVTENYDYINEKPDEMLNDEHFHNFNQNFDYFKYNEEIPQINTLHVNKNNENIGFNYNDNRTNDYSNVFSQNTFDIPLDDYENQIKHNIINQTYVEKVNNVNTVENNDLETNYSQNAHITNKVVEEDKEKILDNVNEIDHIIEQDNDFNDTEETNQISTDDETQSNILNTDDTKVEESGEVESLQAINIKKKKKKGFKKIVLSLEEQKKELERNRKCKKYTEAEFKCYNCAIGFLFKDTYQAHMMRHEESNGEFRCLTCTLRFSTHALLRTHNTSHSDIYECLNCGQMLKPRAKRTHPCFKTKCEENVSCHLCGNLFRDGNGLQQHLRRVHAKASNRLHSCTICNENFTNPSVLKTHMIKHINRKFQCEQCPAVYKSPYTLAQHKRKHEVFGEKHCCTLCDVVFDSRKSLLAHFRRTAAHQNNVLECPICGRVCATQPALEAHAQTHASAQYTCTHCTNSYSTRKSLIRHLRLHTGRDLIAPAVCHLCGNSFKGKNKLNRHLKQVCEKAKLEEQLASLYE